jgi:hypothetical protein
MGYMMATNEERTRENRARRVAERRGYRLEKTRRRDPQAIDYGTFYLISLATGRQAFASTSLDEVEAFLEKANK